MFSMENIELCDLTQKSIFEKLKKKRNKKVNTIA